MAFTDYTTSANALSAWIEDIAPNYFDFDVGELHRTGVFGYINEVMSQSELDAHHAVSIARREFYPTTAIYRKNLFKMAALHRLGYPLANAATCTATLLFKEEELLKYATRVDGSTYNFIVDNSMVIMADDIPFMLDYPIVIVIKKTIANPNISGDSIDSYSNKAGVIKLSENRTYYTIRYDTTYKNSMNTQTDKYIRSRVIPWAGENLLLIKVGLRQCQRVIEEQAIVKSPTISTVVLDFEFDGNLCNFEVFYLEGDNDPVQLEKLPLNSNPIKSPFCMYSMIDDNTIRLHFPDNAYFTPKFNSTIRMHIYTTMGEYGNFRVFNGSLSCQPQSEDYQYNNMITVQGMCEGSSIGGMNIQNDEDFRSNIVYAYATNKVVTTENDLQAYFDNQALTSRNKILFFKRRDDVFERLYGAFMLLRDEKDNVIPTNSLDIDILRKEMDINILENNETASDLRGCIIKAGRVWEYFGPEWKQWATTQYKLHSAYQYVILDNSNVDELLRLRDVSGHRFKWRISNGSIITLVEDEFTTTEDDGTPISNPVVYSDAMLMRLYYMDTNRLITLNESITEKEEGMYYTNPFLIHINRAHNAIGFYLNTVNDVKTLSLTQINDKSFIQWIMNSLTITRHAIRNENFYKLTIKIQPSIMDDDLQRVLIINRQEIVENENDDGFPMQIFAEDDGIVVGRTYVDGDAYLIVKYYCDNTVEKNYTRYWQTSHMDLTANDGELVYIKISPSIIYNEDDANYTSGPWYSPSYDVGDTFSYGDLLATRNCKDLMVLRAIAELPDEAPGMYIPFVIEDYNVNADFYTMSAYISTEDEISTDDRLVMTDGFYNSATGEKYTDRININPVDCRIRVSIFVQYDDRFALANNTSIPYLKEHTLTNIYETDSNNYVSFLKPMNFIRSTLSSKPSASVELSSDSYIMRLKEIPVVRSVWLKDINNINYLVNMIRKNYSFIENTYDLLENNYTIDMKFCNTYGKSRYYRIGIRDDMRIMDRVNISIKFGIQLDLLSDVNTFKDNFNRFIRNYVESFNDVTNNGNAIQLMDLVTAINNEFDEIVRIEFYGIDDDTAASSQNIESFTRDEIENYVTTSNGITTMGYLDYVPEFINIYLTYENGELVPQINITFLD